MLLFFAFYYRQVLDILLQLEKVFACKHVREIMVFLVDATFESEEAFVAIGYEVSNHFSGKGG